jgi:hypothetical protein
LRTPGRISIRAFYLFPLAIGMAIPIIETSPHKLPE